MTKFMRTNIFMVFVAATLIVMASTMTQSTDAAYFQSAKSLFAQKCSVCHANDGTGNTAKGKEVKARNWKTDPEVKKMTEAKMIEIVSKGKGKMEAYEKTLGKEKVQMLVTYSKELIGK
ncbi:MAG TPA: c-type cytochrome [Blastocatellia bacterium]|nr:c-type cytochrome [Blastocatellia bacterium]